MTEEMDRFINNLVDFNNEVVLNNLIKKVRVTFPIERGYFYIHDRNMKVVLQCAEQSYFSDSPRWEVIPGQRARYMKKERHRKKYLRMMQRGRKR